MLRLKAAELGGNRPELSGRQEEPARTERIMDRSRREAIGDAPKPGKTERKATGAARKAAGAALEGGRLCSPFGRIADTFPFTVTERPIASFTAKSTMFH